MTPERKTPLPGAFIEVARALAEKFGVEPVLYGSVGLARTLGCEIHSEDIDLLVPKRYIANEWLAFRSVIEKLGVLLVDAKEHEFERKGVRIGFGQEEDLLAFAGIEPVSLQREQVSDAVFRTLCTAEYQIVYAKSALDGYRRDHRGKKDIEKLALIAAYQKASKHP